MCFVPMYALEKVHKKACTDFSLLTLKKRNQLSRLRFVFSYLFMFDWHFIRNGNRWFSKVKARNRTTTLHLLNCWWIDAFAENFWWTHGSPRNSIFCFAAIHVPVENPLQEDFGFDTLSLFFGIHHCWCSCPMSVVLFHIKWKLKIRLCLDYGAQNSNSTAWAIDMFARSFIQHSCSISFGQCSEQSLATSATVISIETLKCNKLNSVFVCWLNGWLKRLEYTSLNLYYIAVNRILSPTLDRTR